MSTRQSKIDLFRIFVIFVGCFISYLYFGNSFSFFISVFFVISIAFIFIRDLDLSGAFSGISVLGPIVKKVLQGLFLKNFAYAGLIDKTNSILQSHNIEHIVDKDEIDTIVAYLVLFIVIWIFDNKDKSALGKHAEDDDPEFRNKSFAEKNESFCNHLANKIRNINSELNWNSDTYVPIAAEVEMSAGKKIKRYDDMLKCLKEGRKNATSLPQKLINKVKFSVFGKIRFVNKALNALDRKFESKRIYLVLGDPGSGKSVSLRKLCADLLEEARITGKTPVYINLKTWTDNGSQWSNSHLPTRKDLIAYVREELYSGGDQFTEGFLDKYFDKMLENGRWYFVFDSFDEMPCLMSGERNTELIQHISRLIYDFLSGTDQNGGIIASRLYNRPAGTLNQTYTLTLQKFSDKRIRTMIKQYMSGNVDGLIRSLFKERPDLVALCRNPFHLSLLINYVQKHDDKLPENQFELFKDFIIGRLTRCKYKIEEQKLSIDEIYKAAIHLAISMQNHQGLDYPVEMLLNNTLGLSKEDWEKRLSILEFVKLCRLSGNRQVVSFVHRRFQEFFYVEAMLNEIVTVNESDYAGLLDNTGIRDALVLYSQIGKPEQVQSIIEYCCKAIENNVGNINNIRNEGCVHFVNALYFLTEAFGYRKELLGERISLIAGLNKYLVSETDYIVQMAIVNSISLLPEEDIQKTVLKVFGLNNRWLSAAIVNNCQIIKKLNHEEEISFCWYFNNISLRELLRNFIGVDFSLSLSECFSYVRFVHGIIPVFAVGMLICFILVMIDSNMISLSIHSWKQLGDFPKMRSLKEFIDVYSSINAKDLHITGEIDIFKGNDLFKYEIVLCSLVGLMSYVLYLIESRAVKRLINPYYKKKRDYDNDTEKEKKYKYPDSLSSKRFLLASFYFLLISMQLIMYGEGINVNPEILLLFILVITSIGHIIELIYESKEPFKGFVKRKIDTVQHTNLRRLIVAIPETMLRCIKKLLFLIQIMLVIAMIVVVDIVIFSAIPISLCIMNDIDITVSNTIGVATYIYIPLIAIGMLALVVWIAILSISDIVWINKQTVSKINRAELEENLNKLHSYLSRRKYVKNLMNKDVRLEGDWADKQRKQFGDDVLDRILAQWDCKEYSIDNYFSEGL